MAMTIDPSTGAASTRSSFDEMPHRTQALHGAAARYLGLSPQALRSQLEAGKSLAEIAAAQGKSIDGLKNAILGVLTEGGATGGDTRALVERIVNAHQGREDPQKVMANPTAGPTRATDPVESTLAEYLGLTTEQVRQRIDQGQTLLEIAAARGKDPRELRQTLLSALNEPTGQAGYAGHGQMDALADHLLNARGATRTVSTVA